MVFFWFWVELGVGIVLEIILITLLIKSIQARS